MLKSKKTILGVFLCTVMALCVIFGAVGLTQKTEKAFAGEILTVADVLPDDFPTFSMPLSDKVWVNVNCATSKLYKNLSNGLTFGGIEQFDNFENILSAPVTKVGNDYKFTKDSYTITFVMDSDKLVKITLAGSQYADNNGDYIAPVQDVTIENILPTDFPKSEAGAWKNDNGCFVYNTTEKLEFNNGSVTMKPVTVLVTAKLAAEGENFKYVSMGGWSAVFNMDGDKLASITFDAVNETLKPLNGTYVAPIPTYTVSVVAGENGTVAPTYSGSVQKDTAYTVNGNKITIGETEITATAKEGYEFDCWKIGESKVPESGTITADTTFTATFKAVIPTYTVSVVAGENGTVAPTYSGSVQKDTAYTVNGNKITIGETEITATAKEGYEFDCWKIGESKVTENGTITANTTFIATFKATASPTPTPDPKPENNGLSTGAIIGIVAGSVAFLGLIACAVIIILRKKKDKNEK